MDLATRKERSDMILEPLQVMAQLALLSYSPIGTKVSVSNNILQLHPPSYLQGVYRWYNSDGKDDLYYLFHAIRRYYKWYKNDSSGNKNNNKIYQYLLETGIKGIKKLTETYSSTEQTSITHTLQLYQNILTLESPDVFKDTSDDTVSIDTVFQNIKDVYSDNLLKIIFNTLEMLDSSEEKDKTMYINGLLNILTPTNNKIRGWIREKLTC